MTTFETLLNRYVLTFTLKSEEDLHAGTGQPGESSNAAIARRCGRPFLPGSSVRGVLRSTVERTLTSIFGPARVSCILFSDSSLAPPEQVCMFGNEKKRKEVESGEADESSSPGKLILCPVCRLFGSTLMAGRMKLSDASLIGDAPVEIQVRDGVGIDRDTGSARDGSKFNFDLLTSRVEFRLTATIENVEDEERALLHIILGELEQGIHVGGLRNRGMGLVRCKEFTATKLLREQLVTYLETRQIPVADPEELRAEFKQAFRDFCILYGN